MERHIGCLALLLREADLGRGFYARQRCKSRGWTPSCLYTRNYSLLGHAASSLGVSVCWFPRLEEVPGGLRRSEYSAVARTVTCCESAIPRGTTCGWGWLYDPTRAALPPPLSSSWDFTVSSSRRSSWARRTLAPRYSQRELPSEENWTRFPGEESHLPDVLQRLWFWY